MRHGPLTHATWTIVALSIDTFQHVEISVLGVKVAQKVRASHARLSGACGCVSGREGPETERNGTNGVKLNGVKLKALLCTCEALIVSSSDGWMHKYLSLPLSGLVRTARRRHVSDCEV